MMISAPRIAGIDWSITSPAISLYNNGLYHFFFFVESTKKLPEKTEFEQFILHPTVKNKKYIDNIDRYRILAEWAIGILNECKIDTVFLEGYAMGARSGLAFNIGESTGVLKFLCAQNKIDVIPSPPTTIKKFATGKGNAKKDQMEDSFIEKTGIDLRKYLIQTEKQLSPSSDIVDSYFIFRYGQQTINEKPQIED